MALTRRATAVWEHDLAKGSGHVSAESGVFRSQPIPWSARTEAPGGKTSPEELLAAAQASCFSMALSAGLGRGGTPPDRLTVTAACTFDKVGDAWKVTTMEIDVKGKVPKLGAAEFAEAARKAGEGCPISGALKGNVAIHVTAALES